MTSRVWIATLVFAAVALPARAQEAWTLERLLAHARAHEPQLDAARLNAQARQEDIRQAGLRANPRASLEQRAEIGGMGRQRAVMAEWPLEWGRRGARVATARAELNVAMAAAADRERLVAHAIHVAHHTYLAAARRASVLDEILAEARRTVALLDERAAAGATARIERDQALLEAQRIEVERLKAHGEAEAARIELQRAAGLTPSPSFTLDETLEGVVPWTHINAVLAAAPDPANDARPDVVTALAMAGVEDARREQAAAEGRLDLAVFGGYMRMASGFPQRGFDTAGATVPIEGTFNTAVGGVMVDVPLFNRNQGAVAAAALRATAARRDADALRLAAAAETASAYARLRAAVGAARLFTRQMRDLAQQNVTVVREAYALGRHTLLDVVMEQRRYLDIELAYTDALMDVMDAHAALQTATWRQP